MIPKGPNTYTAGNKSRKSAEKEYERLFNFSIDMLCIAGFDGYFKKLSPSWEKTLGWTKEELLSKPYLNFVHPEDRESTINAAKGLEEGKSAITFENRYLCKDGSYRWISWNSFPQVKENLIFAVARDVTKSKEMEEVLRRAHEELEIRVQKRSAELAEANEELRKVNRALKTLSECNQALVRTTDETDLLREICRIIVETGGYRLAWVGYAEQDKEKTVRPVAQAGYEDGYLESIKITWADTERGRGPTGMAIRTGQPHIARNILADPNFAPWRAEASKRGYASSISLPLISNGQSFGALNIYAVETDAFGEEEIKLLTELSDDLAYGIMALRTRTERRRVEEALQKNEARLQLQINRMPIGLIVWDSEFRVQSWNPAAEKIFVFTAEEMLGKHPYDFIVPKEAQPHVDTIWHRLLEGDTTAHSVNENMTKDGRTIICDWFNTPLKEADGTVVGVLSMVQDITERKDAEKQIQLQLQRITALRNIDTAITASLDLRVILNLFLDQVTTQLRVDAATVLLLNPNTLTLEYTASRGFRSHALRYTYLRLGEGHAGLAALERRIVNIPNLAEAENGFSRAPLLNGEEFIAYYGMPLIAKGQVKGVLEIFHRAPLDPDQNWLDFLGALAAQGAIAIDNATLFDDVQRSNIELVLAYDTTLEGWSKALDLRDKETEGHTLRVTEMTLRLARAMGISETEQVHVRRGALLHDIGKMGIPDTILLKPGRLNEEEWEIMRRHPVYAYDLLSPIAFLRPALDIPYCHHEKWDGTGYPRGLRGEEIPLAARIFAVVDVWDALLSDRPYRPAWPKEKVREYILEQAGKHFDPKVVEVFLKLG